MSYFLASVLLIFVNNVHAFPVTPNPQETTGELCQIDDPDFQEYRYSEKIAYCKRNVDYQKRQEIYDAYRIPKHCRHRYTVDHFIPLSVGGSNDDKNLWPEHKIVKATRPNLELETYENLKAGKITQSEAILKITKIKMETKLPQINLKNFDPPSDCDSLDFSNH